MAYLDAVTRLGPGGGPRTQWVGFSAAAATAAITGTLDGSTEAQIVAGGQTIIITLTNDTWVTGATFSLARAALIGGIDSDLSTVDEPAGWQANFPLLQDNDQVVRTSDTVVTITLTAFPDYDTTQDETITVTVPASMLATSASAVVATPTIGLTADVAVSAATGGWAAQNWYDSYRQTRQRRVEERDKVQESLRELPPTEAEIARLMHIDLEREAREAELASLEAMIRSTYTERQARLAEQYSSKVAKAYTRAAVQGNYSALEGFEREMENAREMEEFIFLAVALLD